jgi:hypothetical protein
MACGSINQELHRGFEHTYFSVPSEYASLDWRSEVPAQEGDWLLFVRVYSEPLLVHVDANGQYWQGGEKFEKPYPDEDILYAPAPKERHPRLRKGVY